MFCDCLDPSCSQTIHHWKVIRYLLVKTFYWTVQVLYMHDMGSFFPFTEILRPTLRERGSLHEKITRKRQSAAEGVGRVQAITHVIWTYPPLWIYYSTFKFLWWLPIFTSQIHTLQEISTVLRTWGRPSWNSMSFWSCMYVRTSYMYICGI